MLESRPALTLSSEIVSRARWQDQRSSMLTIKVMTKPCPKCRIPTERDGGCMHMECTRCNFQWCWLCQSMVNKPILLHKTFLHQVWDIHGSCLLMGFFIENWHTYLEQSA